MNWLKERSIPIFILSFLTIAMIGLSFLEGPYSQGNNNYNTKYNATKQSDTRPDAASLLPKIKQSPSTNQGENKPNWKTRDHKAQIKMMWAAWVAVGMTFIGLILVGYTLHFTRKAAEAAADTLIEAGKVTALAEKTSKAEFQPYLTFSNKIELNQLRLSRFKGHDKIVGAVAFKSDHHIQIAPRIVITNKGKTPATDFFITHSGNIANTRVEGRGTDDAKTVRETFRFSSYRVGPIYIGLGDEEPADLSLSIVFDKEKELKYIEAFKSGSPLNTTYETSFLNASFFFNVVVSFKDQFSKSRRAFSLTYLGRINEDWVHLAGSHELLSHEDGYKDNQKQFETFIKGHHSPPET